MPSTKILLRYCLFLFAGYGLLLWLFWQPPVAKVAAISFHGLTMPVVKMTLPSLTFFTKAPEGDHFYDYKIRFISKEELEQQKVAARQQGKTQLDLSGGTVLELRYHQVFFNPWFFLLCLVLVTPLGWKKKLPAALAASLIFWVFAIGKINFIIRQQLHPAGSAGWTGGLLDVLVSPAFVGFTVIAIWALVAFRKNNWQELLKKSGQTSLPKKQPIPESPSVDR